MTRQYKADTGVMITVSHNPVEYNGIKFFDGRGYKLSDELEDAEIIEVINDVEAKLNGVGRVIIRPSGTEILVRVMLEGENQEEINEMENSLVDLILRKI